MFKKIFHGICFVLGLSHTTAPVEIDFRSLRISPPAANAAAGAPHVKEARDISRNKAGSLSNAPGELKPLDNEEFFKNLFDVSWTDPKKIGRGGCWVNKEDALKNCVPDDLLCGPWKPYRKAVSAFGLCGFCEQMQDAVDAYKKGNWLGFAVYDGHGKYNNLVAEGLAGIIKQDVMKSSEEIRRPTNRLLPKLIEMVEHTFAEKGFIEKSIHKLYIEADTGFRWITGGSTAIVCLINLTTHRGLFINLGNSRAALFQGDRCVLQTNDHKPEVSTERPLLRCWEVEVPHKDDLAARPLALNVSRTFGDYYREPSKEIIICQEDVYFFDLTDATMIVLASDGVWDVEQANGFMAGLLAEAHARRWFPAELLCKHALMTGSNDNCSAIVIDLAELLALSKAVRR